MRRILFAMAAAAGLAACSVDNYDDRHQRGYGGSGYGRDDYGRDNYDRYGYGSYYPYGRVDYPRDRIWIIDRWNGCRYYAYQGYCYRYKDDYYRAMDWDRKHGYDDNWHNKRKDWCNRHDCSRDHDAHHRDDGRWDDDRQPENRRYRGVEVQPATKPAPPVAPPPKRPDDRSGSGWGSWGNTDSRHDRDVPTQGRPSPGWEPPVDSRPSSSDDSSGRDSSRRYRQQVIQPSRGDDAGSAAPSTSRSYGGVRDSGRQRTVDTSGSSDSSSGSSDTGRHQRGQRVEPATDPGQ